MFLSSCVQPQYLTFGIGTKNRSLSHQRKDGTRSAISHMFKFRFLYLFCSKAYKLLNLEVSLMIYFELC